MVSFSIFFFFLHSGKQGSANTYTRLNGSPGRAELVILDQDSVSAKKSFAHPSLLTLAAKTSGKESRCAWV